MTVINIVVFLLLIAVAVAAFMTYRYLRLKEEFEIREGINYFASRIYLHQDIEEMLWDLTTSIISKLKFEDCVIYLLDERKENLIQVAAYGPKSLEDQTIAEPIIIPVGKGIVGSVAKDNRTEIIQDTTKDPRYILDDQLRYSEITVPVSLSGEVFGVIDSEHSQKGFYHKGHQRVLEEIAAIAAQKIKLLRNQHILEAQKDIIRQKESDMQAWKLQALQNQMDPHFIMNALNSLQSLILSQNHNQAIFYLSKFSKLLHHIFKQSEHSGITLIKEIHFVREYIQMEALRFSKDIEFITTIDESIDPEDIIIPTFILQPIVENSIWHGFSGRQDNCIIEMKITRRSDTNGLDIIIRDNGKGKESGGFPQKLESGKGLKIVRERLQSWSQVHQNKNMMHSDIPFSGGFETTIYLSILTSDDQGLYFG
jgi:two-component system LytT family sensor kinase